MQDFVHQPYHNPPKVRKGPGRRSPKRLKPKNSKTPQTPKTPRAYARRHSKPGVSRLKVVVVMSRRDLHASSAELPVHHGVRDHHLKTTQVSKDSETDNQTLYPKLRN